MVFQYLTVLQWRENKSMLESLNLMKKNLQEQGTWKKEKDLPLGHEQENTKMNLKEKRLQKIGNPQISEDGLALQSIHQDQVPEQDLVRLLIEFQQKVGL